MTYITRTRKRKKRIDAYKVLIVPCFQEACLIQPYAKQDATGKWSGARAITDYTTVTVAAQKDTATFGALIGHEWLHSVFYCLGFMEPWGKDICGNAIDLHHWFGWVLKHRSMNGAAPVTTGCIDAAWISTRESLLPLLTARIKKGT